MPRWTIRCDLTGRRRVDEPNEMFPGPIRVPRRVYLSTPGRVVTVGGWPPITVEKSR